AIAAGAQGIGFAIPIDAVKDIVPQLLAKGYVSRGRLGASIQPVDTKVAHSLGFDRPKGALVAGVEPGSAAEKAGLKAGDVIVGVDQTDIPHAHDLPRIVARRPPGSRVTLHVVGSNKATRNVVATLDELRDEEADQRR